ncbi:MAG: hypothetical protein CM15mP42_05140 [Methanobacteriota archaeon]|nr:MAG: hypothetical protein CM15mP42_05140 [Euryarchaeota archaeon]
MQNGKFVRLDDYDYALDVVDQVKEIVDLGELLIPVGEFLEIIIHYNHQVGVMNGGT